MSSVVVVVVVMLASLGCRKAAIGIAAGTTVATATTGALLVSSADKRSGTYGTGVVLLSYSMVGLIIASVLLATPSTATADTSSSGAYGWSASDDSVPAATAHDAPPDDERGIDVAGRGANGGHFYDRTGAMAGRADPDGRYYDRTGAAAGRIDPDGRYYDRTGSSHGRLDPDGRVYDRTGSSAGRIDNDGRFYDRTGSSAGRIDSDGRIYDATGSYAGRVDGNCDDACRRETAGRILLAPK